jgi:hypothetical protein
VQTPRSKFLIMSNLLRACLAKTFNKPVGKMGRLSWGLLVTVRSDNLPLHFQVSETLAWRVALFRGPH